MYNFHQTDERFDVRPNLLRRRGDVAMGFRLYYRSIETMHPALAFEISADADRLMQQFQWRECGPVKLKQRPDGFLAGESGAWYSSGDVHEDSESGLPQAVLMTIVDVLCRLSAAHNVDWMVGHDYEIGPVGRICDGIAESDLIEEIETLDGIGDLIDDIDLDDIDLDDIDLDDGEVGDWHEFGLRDYHAAAPVDVLRGDVLRGDVLRGDVLRGDVQEDKDPWDDDGPRLLKFPGTE